MKTISILIFCLTLAACEGLNLQYHNPPANEHDSSDAYSPLCGTVDLGKHGVYRCRIR
jgi:hypothetical protein